jgi:hypothetical protein
MRTQLPIALGYYVDESIAISGRRCMNFYPHIPEGQTLTQGALFGVGGISLAVDTESPSPCRGGHALVGTPYFVYGERLLRIDYSLDVYSYVDVSGTEAILGTDRVFMADNGTQICIVAPDETSQFNAWIYTVAGGLVRVSDSDFDGPATDVRFSDGYFMFGKQDSNVWFVSDLRDGLAYNALDFTSAESDPDDIVAVHPLRGMVYVFGSQTMEPYQNVGGAGFPYVRLNSGIYNKGCTAPHSVVEFNNSLIWIGGSENEQPAVWATDGGPPVKISPPSIDVRIYEQGIEPVRSAYSIRWAERGHSFVAFTVPGVCTVVYDMTTQTWHERQSFDVFFLEQPWRAAALVDAYSTLLLGDSITSFVGVYDSEISTEYDEDIRGYFTPPPIDNDGKPFSILAVELVMQTGTVPLDGDGSNPQIRLSMSKDGGRTFGTQISRSVGLIGNYTKRIAWGQRGRFGRSALPRFDISAPIKRVIVKMEVEIGS